MVAAPAIAADPPAACDTIFAGAEFPVVNLAYNDSAYRTATANIEAAKLTEDLKNTALKAANTIKLGDVVAVRGANLEKMFAGECAKKTVVLFLNKRPMKGLVRSPPSDPLDKTIYFTLARNSEARDAWVTILGSPLTNEHKVDVSIGFDDGFPLKNVPAQSARLTFDVVPTLRFAFWAFAICAVFGMFVWLARRSNIIRDPSPVLDDSLGTYSLSRLQGAWWFFVIISTYVFIGVITGDFSNSVNSTALILLGIGAGTVVGSAAIDAQKDTPEQRDSTKKAIAKVQEQLDALPADSLNRSRLVSQLRKLQGQSEGVVMDILSDANGISFHRFQIAVWTVVLSIIFVFDVYQTLAMPEFNTTLMGMMGLSAGTYLGLKIPEPMTPSKPPLGK